MAYRRAWEEFLSLRAARRPHDEQGCLQRTYDAVSFIMSNIDKKIMATTIAGKLADLSLYGNLFWEYEPSAEEMGSRLLQRWAKEKQTTRSARDPISIKVLIVIGITRIKRMPMLRCSRDSSTTVGSIVLRFYINRKQELAKPIDLTGSRRDYVKRTHVQTGKASTLLTRILRDGDRGTPETALRDPAGHIRYS
ncbi:hypothetical protein NDU88_007334 [Pleurodeles waltl]|uniref:Uncharacterized protein n=1 Tax=Pleurodeles waltl TaxID=8319 RepID=A0AAV7QKC1_PLEWA|nr:hypothetical protein NDU88_007334 [Pleurodeles waltl]